MNEINAVNQWLSCHYGGITLEKVVLPGGGGVKLYLISENYKNTVFEDETITSFMDTPPYWIFCWASGVVLAEQIAKGAIDVKGKVIVDFGAGSGVVGIAAALNGAKQVFCCEIDPLARKMIQYNAKLNGVVVSCVERLEEVEDCLSTASIDCVLVADVLYDRSNIGLLEEIKKYSGNILLADSRVKDLAVPDYLRLGMYRSCSYPDFAESAEFNSVNLYHYSK